MKLFNEAEQEHLKEISANLQVVRQEKSIPIEEIAAQTHIRLVLLQALEAGRFEELPEPVFVKGFIRRYADALGLDGTSLANSWNINHLPVSLPPENQENLNVPRFRLSAYIPIFLPYLILLLTSALGLLYLLNFQSHRKFLTQQYSPLSISQQKVQSSPLAVPPAPSPTSTKTVTPLPISPINLTPTPLSTNTPVPKQVKVTLELKGTSWLQIKADGKTEFEGVLNKGTKKTWTAKDSLTVRIGNAGVVLVSVNEKPSKLLGTDGEVKEMTYSKEEKLSEAIEE